MLSPPNKTLLRLSQPKDYLFTLTGDNCSTALAAAAHPKALASFTELTIRANLTGCGRVVRAALKYAPGQMWTTPLLSQRSAALGSLRTV